MIAPEVETHAKRFKLIFVLVCFVGLLLFHVVMLYSQLHQQALSAKARWFLYTAATGLLVIPAGYIYGRNSARRDELGRLGRFVAYIAMTGLVVGLAYVKEWGMVTGGCAGVLLGWGLGRLVCLRVRRNNGDSPESDRILNVIASPASLQRQRASWIYLQSLDPKVRRRVLWLVYGQQLLFCLGIALVLGIEAADWPARFQQLLYTAVFHSDGVIYVIPANSEYVWLQLSYLSVFGLLSVFYKCLPRMAGAHMAHYLEYSRLAGIEQGTVKLEPVVSRFGKPVANILAIVALMSCVLYLDDYVIVNSQGVTISRYWDIGSKHYGWPDVSNVVVDKQQYFCPKCGGMHTVLDVAVHFTDGSEWAPDCGRQRCAEIEQAVRYVASKTGR